MVHTENIQGVVTQLSLAWNFYFQLCILSQINVFHLVA